MTTILVTDGELRATLAAVRSLGPVHRTLVAASRAPCLAGLSRFAAGTRAAPDPLADPARYRAAVAEIVATDAVDLVLPVSDAASRALLAAPEALAGARLAAAKRDAYLRLSHKGEVARLGAAAGLDVPEGEEAADVEAAVSVGAALGYPVVVKPVLSVDEGPASARKRGVLVARDEASLRAAWPAGVAPGAALVQRLVPGTGEGLFLLRTEGRTRAVFAHRRVREKPPAGGVAVLCESVAVAPDVLARVESVLDACGFSGVAMAEFRRDGERRWLMEFNARLWGSLQLALDAGVDFPRLLVDATLGVPAAAPPAYAVGLRSRWLLGDVDHALALARGARRADGHSGWAAAIGVLLRPAHARLESPRADDWRPFAHELRIWLRNLAGSGGS